jgi:glycerol-3-phosphate acyltransferase PlsY
MLYLCIAFAVIIPYVLCSINPAIVVTKIKSGKDIRELGSGNPGLTNVLRTQGKGAAVVVLLFDVLKGVVSIFMIMLFCRYFAPVEVGGDSFPLYRFTVDLCMWIGSLSAVLGHCYPVYYKFSGGKAVLVTVATGLVINWLAALIALVLFILIVVVTKYVSVGSVIAAAAYPVCVGAVGTGGVIGTAFSAAIAVILIYKHKQNIKRLATGKEKKLGEKGGKKGKDSPHG